MAKFYVDLNRVYTKIVESWDECETIRKEFSGVNFKKYSSKEEAEKVLKEETAAKCCDALKSKEKSAAKPEGHGIKPAAGAYIIGCDEVGKVEPFKQMVSVAVFADPKVNRDIKGGDSKGNSKEEDIEIGKAITDFKSYDDIDSEAHYNKELGIIYCVKILTNNQYNVLKDTGRNVDVVLSCLHNSSLLAVYDEAQKQGFDIDCFVIDDYLSNAGDHRVAFAENVEAHKKGTRKINDMDANIFLTKKAENKYPDTVGLASNIGDYVDQLWQQKCKEDFSKDGIKFEEGWFSNFGKNAQVEITKVFNLLKNKYGDVDNSPYIPKHTKYYITYKKQEMAK